MHKIRDLSGQTFGRLRVVQRVPYVEGKAQWNCRCSCGTPRIIIIMGQHLVSGDTRSCGCLRRERTIAYNEQRKGE